MSNSTIVLETTRRRRIRDSVADMLAGIRDGRDLQARYDELSRLTPLELARLGLTRDDISHVAATGVRLQSLYERLVALAETDSERPDLVGARRFLAMQ